MAFYQIRLKRLERLRAAQAESSSEAGASSSNASPSSSSAGPSSTAPRQSAPVAVSSVNGAASSASSAPVTKAAAKTASNKISTPTSNSPTKSLPQSRASPAPSQNASIAPASSSSIAANLSIPYPQWLSGTISRILQVTLSQVRAEASNWTTTYLYSLHDELLEEAGGAESDSILRFNEDNLERAIVARLSMDPAQMVDDEEAEKNPIAVTVLAGLPTDLTNLEYLVGCWRRWHTERTRLGNPKATDAEVMKRAQALDYIKQKLLEGIGLQLQEPELFPQPSG